MSMIRSALLAAFAAATLSACADVQAPKSSLADVATSASSRSEAPFIAFAMAATETHTCALAPGSNLQCWGSNAGGQLGVGALGGTFDTPQRVEGRFTQVSAGGVHTCALDQEGAAWCWGRNLFGELGIGGTAAASTPQQVQTAARFTSIRAGNQFTCALTAAGEAYCWGSDASGVLGTVAVERCGPTSRTCSDVPVKVGGGHVFEQLEVGLWNACGLTAAGNAICWGNNLYRQLGDGTAPRMLSSVPGAVAGGHTFRQISVGAVHMCGVTTSDQVYCWGDNTYGNLGDGTTTSAPLPVLSAAGAAYRTVVAGPGNVIFTHSCGIATDNQLYCWGANSEGQLGTRASLPTCGVRTIWLRACSTTPIRVETDVAFASVNLASQYTCGISERRRAYCWGHNGSGQLGVPSVTTSTPVVTPVTTWSRGRAPASSASAAPAVTGDDESF